MRDSSSLKKQNAKVYYRDKLGNVGAYEFVEGIVLDYKSVKDANRDWNQQWNRTGGTILKIGSKDKRVNDPEQARYRHLSSVLTPEQYDHRKRKK